MKIKFLVILIHISASLIHSQSIDLVGVLKNNNVDLKNGTNIQLKNSYWKSKYYINYNISKKDVYEENEDVFIKFKDDSIIEYRSDSSGILKVYQANKYIIQMFDSANYSNLIKVYTKGSIIFYYWKLYKVTTDYLVYELLLPNNMNKKREWRYKKTIRFLLVKTKNS